MAKFQIYRDIAGYFRWRLVANNNEKVAASEAYNSKQGAKESASKVRDWSYDSDIEDLT